jgi:hypothetical protein
MANFFEQIANGDFTADQMAYLASQNDKYESTYTNNQGKLVGVDAQGGHWELTDENGNSVADDAAWYAPVAEPGVETEQEYFNAEGDTGWDNDTKILSYYDPIKGYTTKDFSGQSLDEINGWKEANGVGRYTNSAGDYVLGIMPTTTYVDTENEILMEGADPNWVTTVNPDKNGMGDDGGQRTPWNVDDWSGSDTHDVDGNVIPGGQGDPTSIPVYEPPRLPDPPTDTGTGVDTTTDWGTGTGVTPTTGNDDFGNQPLPGLIGYESSSNKDFYQKQFQDLRAQTMRQQGAEQLASQYDDPIGTGPFDGMSRRELDKLEELKGLSPQQIESLNDPWGWAGGSEQFAPSISDGSAAPAADWTMNSQYEGLDDASIARQAMTLGAFNEEDSRLMEGFLPQWEGTYQFRNSGSPGTFAANNSGLAPKNQATIGKILNQVYSQGQAGPTVAAGYANPLSPAGGQ